MGDAELHVCDVCRIVDKDETVKLCQFCTSCKAWICDTCRSNPIRRTHAALGRTTAQVTNTVVTATRRVFNISKL